MPKNEELFYASENEGAGCVFWIPGYCDHKDNIDDIILMLKGKRAAFAVATGVPMASVCSQVIDGASRYKGMRVFYAKVNSAGKFGLPACIRTLDDSWTMQKWLDV